MLKVATLFSGIGTPEQSLKHLQVEHETVFACKIDRFARTTYLANNQAPNTFYDDVYNIDGNKYRNQIDILISSSPCQSFSIAGNGMSRNILDMIFTQIFTCYVKHIESKQYCSGGYIKDAHNYVGIINN